VPDWRTYTVGEHTPELLKNERMLKSLGLKDPWARNEVWRFDRTNPRYEVGSYKRLKVIYRGFAIGFGVAVITAGIRIYFRLKEGHGHGHGDHGHGGHH
jgi:NADH-ubiquinone oxidoreductase B12 subunit family